MDTKTLIMAAGVFGAGFVVSAVVAHLLEPHTRVEVRPMTATIDTTFHKVSEEEAAADDGASQRTADQLMEDMRTGNVPDSAISEGADDAPPIDGHYFQTIVTQYNGIDKWRPAQPGMRIACFSGRQGKATTHFIVHYDGEHMAAHDASLNEWVFSGCSDSVHIGYATQATHELNATQYLKARLSMVPPTADFAATRAQLAEQIKTAGAKGFFGA